MVLVGTTVHSGRNLSRFKNSCVPIETGWVRSSEIGFFLEVYHLIICRQTLIFVNF